MTARLSLDDEDIITRYNAGESMNSIAASYHVSYRPIAARLRAAGVAIRDRGKQRSTPIKRTPHPIAVELRRIRLLYDMTQREVARRAGIDESTLRNIEVGRSDGNLRQIYAIAGALGRELKLVLDPKSRFDKNQIRPTGTAASSIERHADS